MKERLNGDGTDDPGEDPNSLLAHYCVPCGVGTYCPAQEAGTLEAGAQRRASEKQAEPPSARCGECEGVWSTARDVCWVRRCREAPPCGYLCGALCA